MSGRRILSVLGCVLIIGASGLIDAGTAPAAGASAAVSYIGFDQAAGGLSASPADGTVTSGADLYEVGVGSSDYGGMWFEMFSRHPLHVGLYDYAAPSPGDPSENVHVRIGGTDYPYAIGYVRVLQVVAATSSQPARFAATFVLTGNPGADPILYGTVGLNTTVPPAVPGETAKARLGDFDGNGSTDVAVWRPSTGQWFVRGRAAIAYGRRGNVPVPGDYDGNGSTDVAVWRPSTGQWFVRGLGAIAYGRRGDVPVPGDYDGNGATDVAVWRPSTGQWFVRGLGAITYGIRGDIPVASDYDGNGSTDVAVWRPSTGRWFVRGAASVTLGRAGDVPVPGPYDCGIPPCPADPSRRAVFRPTTAQWFFEQPKYQVAANDAIRPGDVPTPGAYGSDYLDVLAAFRPSTGTWILPKVTVRYGTSGDVPV